MFTPGPLEIVLGALLSIRRFGFGRTLLGGVALAIGIQPLLPPVSCGCFQPLLRRCDRTPPYAAAMRSDLKNLASQQEIYYSDVFRYSDDPAVLAFTHSDGVEMVIRAEDDGWVARATHVALGDEKACAMYYGRALWLDDDSAEWTALLSKAQPGELVCS